MDPEEIPMLNFWDLIDAAMHEAVPAIAALGVSPLVRIPDMQGWMVKSMSLNNAANYGRLLMALSVQERWIAELTE